MATSALNDRDKYSELFLRATWWSGLLIPIATVLYGWAVFFNLLPQGPLYSPEALGTVLVLFMILGATQFILKPSTPKPLGVSVSLYHIFGISALIFGAGTTTPLATCWIILIVITDIFYGWRIAVVTGLIYVVASIVTFLAEPSITWTVSVGYIMYTLMILISGSLIGILRGVQRVEHSDLKRTQQQEQLQRSQLTALINSVGVAILSTSHTGTIRIYNAALLNLLDTNQSLSGKRLDDVLHLYDRNDDPVSLLDILARSDHLIERDDLSHRFSDGETIRLSVSYAPIRGHYSVHSQQHEGYIFIIRDITKAKSLEEERDEFISVVSHELRTPVTIAEGTLSNLQFLLDHNNDPKQLGSALKDAHEQIVYLASMVNDLSTLSRAERDIADAPEHVNIKELLEELYHQYQKRAEGKALHLNINVPQTIGFVSTSRLYIEEILQNFITNAIKYTEQGSVTMSVKRVGKGVEFEVRDTGIGISKADQKRIFEKFYRSEDYRTRETSGTGLGLYVVRKLAAKLNIDIKVESRLNHGTAFRFVLLDTKDSLTKSHK